MIKRIALIGIFLSMPWGVSNAGEGPDQNAECIGPMCLLTPIYRLGKIVMPNDPPPLVAPPVTPQPSDATVEAPKPGSLPPEKEPSATSDQESDAPLTGHDAIPKNDPRSNSPKIHARPTLQAQHHRTRTQMPLGYKPNKGILSAVTISVGEPEMGRLLALAAVVKKPSISVIPDAGYGPGCSADFVVDTLLDSARLGPAIPLFSESLIIVARNDVSNIRALRERQVSFGPLGGSSERVAQRFFKSLGIPVHTLPLDIDNALDGVALGDLDAVALLAPRGYDRLARHDQGLHLLGLDTGMLPPEGLRVSRIDPASYLGGTWSDRSLSVITVDAVLSPTREATSHPSAMSLYAALDRGAPRLAQNGFDLIGDDSQVVTMRSVAKDASLPLAQPMRLERGFSAMGCDK